MVYNIIKDSGKIRRSVLLLKIEEVLDVQWRLIRVDGMLYMLTDEGKIIKDGYFYRAVAQDGSPR